MTSELSQASRSFLDDLAASLARPEPAQPEPVAVGPWQEAAAVLHVFTLDTLRSEAGEPPAGERSRLLRLSEPAPGYRHVAGRSLKADARRAGLRQVASAEAALALIALSPGRIRTTIQRLFERLLGGGEVELARLSHAELIALEEADGWAAELGARRFDPDELRVATNSAAAVAPFGHLLVEDFVGRDNLMAELRAFAGLESPDDGVDAWPPPRLMFIEGPGGVGKSAAIGHFLHGHRADEAGPLFPFAYLAFDDESLDIRQPQAILSELARQFERLVRLQHSLHGPTKATEMFEATMDDFGLLGSRFVEGQTLLSGRRSDYASLGDRVFASRSGSVDVVTGFALLADLASEAMRRPVDPAAVGPAPVSLVLFDTFEEVEYRARESLLRFWHMLDELFRASKTIRVIVSGRGPLPSYHFEVGQRRFVLGELDEASAAELIGRECGLPREDAVRVARQVGGLPLSLRMAARIINDPERGGVSRIGSELVVGHLYRRLLDHIHDEDVRRLAHPGMLLRRLTPEVIRCVLVPACELEEVSEERARELFEGLKLEHTLVRLDDDRSLRFREDVRGPAIRLLAADQPRLARRIHEAASDFYGGLDDPVSAAEHIYHVLMLGRGTWEIDPRWQPELERYLGNALPDLPPEAQVWLATRMSVELAPELLQQADVTDWERITGPKVHALLLEGAFDDALRLLRNRADRTLDSPLFATEVRLLTVQGKLDEAQHVVENRLRDYPAAGNPGRRAELTWLKYQVEYRRGDLRAARRTLKELVALAKGLTSRLPLVQALVTRIEIADPDRPDDATLFRDALLGALREVTEEDAYREPDVVRTALAALAPETVVEVHHLVRPLSASLFDVVRQSRLKVEMHWLAWLRDAAAQVATKEAERRGVPAYLADAAGIALDRFVDGASPQVASQLHSMLDTAVVVLGGSGTAEPASERILAAKVVWAILQMETGDLSAATLAGLDDYRAEWEQAQTLETVLASA